MSTYAIRFLPADPARRDEPAMYLSTDFDFGLTSVAADLREYPFEYLAQIMASHPVVASECHRESLVADVVPYAAALADCSNIEPH